MNFFKTKARIVRDLYLGYEVQFRPWWWPFYRQYGSNTHSSIEKAEVYARDRLSKVIKYVELEE